MALKIYWTDFAKSELQNIFDYYKQNAGVKTTQKIIAGIVRTTTKLNRQPLAGQREEMLVERPEGFRYLVYKYYKIIYWVNREKKQIEIVDVFDTRQNPEKIKRAGS
jgi:plasmid stabilization system protein ParE